MMRSSVDFPQPLGPSRLTNSPPRREADVPQRLVEAPLRLNVLLLRRCGRRTIGRHGVALGPAALGAGTEPAK